MAPIVVGRVPADLSLVLAVEPGLGLVLPAIGQLSVRRWRAALAGFFKWCIAERLVSTNPVTRTVVPRKSGAPVRMHPLTAAELDSVVDAVRHHDPHTADLILIAAWSGLRWSELRAVRVAHFARVPLPLLVVQEARPEGMETKTTKGRRARRVPIAERILPLVETFAAGKDGSDLLFTSPSGAQLHAAAFKRASRWKETARGRRLHDLRHTAICLWLAHGVDPATVQAWAGHASIATTNLYVTHLGTGADRAGLDRLNLDPPMSLGL